MIPTERLFYTLVDVTRELSVTVYEESLTSRRHPNVPHPVDLAAALAIVSNAWFKQFLGELRARVPHRAFAVAEVAEKAPDALPVPAAACRFTSAGLPVACAKPSASPIAAPSCSARM